MNEILTMNMEEIKTLLKEIQSCQNEFSIVISFDNSGKEEEYLGKWLESTI